jgi:hypothetical protein
MAGKGKAGKGRGSVGKKGGPASTPRVERARKGASRSGGASKSVPKVSKKETGRGDGTGGLH